MASKHARQPGSSSGKGSRIAMPQVNPRSKKAGNASSQITTVRVGDLRNPSPKMRSNKPWLARFIIALVLIVALIGGSIYVYASDVLSIDEVRVSGVHHLTAEEISRLANVPASSTLARIDTDAIKERLEENSWVESAQVNRIFPHTLELAITERAISAVVEVTNVEKQEMESWAVSKDGMWLMYIPPEDSEEAESISEQVYEDARYVFHITEVPLGIHPEAGTFCTDSSVLNALSIVSGFTTSLADQVVVVSATDTANTILTLDNGIQIAFGTADDIRDKERVCLKLMEEYPDQISYINVRVVDKPTWRAIGAW